jgi:hypothetical protein
MTILIIINKGISRIRRNMAKAISKKSIQVSWKFFDLGFLIKSELPSSKKIPSGEMIKYI